MRLMRSRGTGVRKGGKKISDELCAREKKAGEALAKMRERSK